MRAEWQILDLSPKYQGGGCPGYFFFLFNEAPCGGLELNMGHLEEQLAVLTSDPSL